MPCVSKETLSQFIRSGCMRQLRLNLSPDKEPYREERRAEGMPAPIPRPGLTQTAEAGRAWQDEKIANLSEAFGADALIGDYAVDYRGKGRYRKMALADALPRARPGQFLVEAEYPVGDAFRNALCLDDALDLAGARPDLIEALPPGTFGEYVLPDGSRRDLAAGDTRPQLRVIDIKLTGDPARHYFAEIAYYAMTLSAWLVDAGLSDRYVVVPNGAVWPGSHEAARLTVLVREMERQARRPSAEQLRAAMREDLEEVAFDAFALRVRAFFRTDVPKALSQPWHAFAPYVDGRCNTCAYLGYPWLNPARRPAETTNHCFPLAERTGSLSRVAHLSQGASAALEEAGVKDTDALAGCRETDAALDGHQLLRAGRTVVPGRAVALRDGQAFLPPNSGGSAVMPGWADLRIYVSAHFETGSAITLALGLKAFWREPRDYGAPDVGGRATKPWPPNVFVVDARSLEAEWREFQAFLKALSTILEEARRLDEKTSVQIYVWERLEYEHLTRLVGRHLNAILADGALKNLAWLFPSEDLLPNPALSTRASPITVVGDVARSVLAAPVPHHYGLLPVARAYHPERTPEGVAAFSVHPLFEEVLSDQIPSERAHEIWGRSSAPRHWADQVGLLRAAIFTRLNALDNVRERLEDDLRPYLLQRAPGIRIGPPERISRLSFDGQLWALFAKLDQALVAAERQQVRAMPAHEREARFQSARLSRRLAPDEEQRALQTLNLEPKPGRRVYRMRPASRDVKVREGDFGLALAPEGQPGFLDRIRNAVTKGTPLQSQDGSGWNETMGHLTDVTVAALDRENLLIVVEAKRQWPTVLDELESSGIADLSRDVTLDPVHHDYFTKKVVTALTAIGNPACARADPLVRRAVGQSDGRGSHASEHTPPADLLWLAPAMHRSHVDRDLAATRRALEDGGIALNEAQWRAWTEALSRRLTRVWGPPGTGKSRVAAAVVLGAVVDAVCREQPLRVLVCASTYRAMDNVLQSVFGRLAEWGMNRQVGLARLHSHFQEPSAEYPAGLGIEVNQRAPSDRLLNLRKWLTRKRGTVVVGSTPGQIHNLMIASRTAGKPAPAQQELFDLILIDEASQMDVMSAILPLCALAEGGSVVLAGDSRQLPPIHKAEAPLGLEPLVGSIDRFLEEVHDIAHVMLEENYRSNAEIVAFGRHAGYGERLRPVVPDLRLGYAAALPADRPSDWPAELFWTPAWADVLDPKRPAACFVYADGRSSQWNAFEADAVAAMAWLLYGRLAPPSAASSPDTAEPYNFDAFWSQGVGIVTPHRAQQGRIVDALQAAFTGTGGDPKRIRDAVDTVERFQGQQRDLIIASFALGDPDAIRDEEEFLLSWNRFNVMVSRARAKAVVLVTREVVDHLADDPRTLRRSVLLKRFVEIYCDHARPLTLGHIHNGVPRPVTGALRWAGGNS